VLLLKSEVLISRLLWCRVEAPAKNCLEALDSGLAKEAFRHRTPMQALLRFFVLWGKFRMCRFDQNIVWDQDRRCYDLTDLHFRKTASQRNLDDHGSKSLR
jgi:hypothetical protein